MPYLFLIIYRIVETHYLLRSKNTFSIKTFFCNYIAKNIYFILFVKFIYYDI